MTIETKRKGLWIAFEGTDGGGKSTQLSRFADHLLSLDYEVLQTSEPGGPLPRYEPENEEYRRSIRGLIFDDFNKDNPKIQLLLFVADRIRHIQKTVLPAIKQGKIVLSDRSEGSTLAYQHYQYKIPWSRVMDINDYATGSKRPHITVLFDVDPEIGARRVASARKLDTNFFDKADMASMKRRRLGYLDMANRWKQLGLNRWIVIDANLPQEKVYRQLVEITVPFLPKKP